MNIQALAPYLNLVLVLAAIACERWLPLVSWYHPFTLLRLAFSNCVKRTFNPSASASYLILSAFLALLFCVFLPVLFVALFSEFVYYPELLGGIVLYVCLDSHTPRRSALRIALHLSQQRKALARALLETICVRDSSRLTAEGISKACIESSLLRMLGGYFTPLFLFCAVGTLSCLAYTLLWHVHLAMRQYAQPNSVYLLPSKYLLSICQLPALLLTLIPLLIFYNSALIWRYLKRYAQHFYHRISGILLSAFSAILNVQLGGPAFYCGQRFERMRISLHRQPSYKDITHTWYILDRLTLVWVFGISFIFLIAVFFA